VSIKWIVVKSPYFNFIIGADANILWDDWYFGVNAGVAFGNKK